MLDEDESPDLAVVRVVNVATSFLEQAKRTANSAEASSLNHHAVCALLAGILEQVALARMEATSRSAPNA